MGRNEVPIRVVHVDDEPDFARLAATNIERAHDRISVRTATAAGAALDLVSPETDCVVSDYAMPDMTGLELFEAVREQYPTLPFILFTDTGSEAIASEAISAGVSDYLIKGVVSEQYALLANKIVTNVERRRAERQAAQTERQLHELAEHTEDVLWMFSADWSELQFINSAYETVFERPIETIRDRPDAFLDAIHPDDRDRVRLAMERVTAGGSERIEYRVQTDTTEKWVESHAKAIVEDGTVVRVVGFTRDVTERKRWEQELKKKNDQLDRFASMVAHDLRNPWNVADGFLDLARADHDSDELATVSKALDRMDRIVTDLLSLARAGATIDAKEPVVLADLAATAWEAVAHNHASLRVETDLVVSGDPNRLAHVFENLFRNAIEHGGETVTIRVGTLDAGAGFYVEDDGPGIPAADRTTAFESGYSTTPDGTGFGLAIVREVVTAHGWEIGATESADGGARFEISGVGVAGDPA